MDRGVNNFLLRTGDSFLIWNINVFNIESWGDYKKVESNFYNRRMGVVKIFM